MKIKINAIILIVTIIIASKTVAQEHTNSWFRITLSVPVTEKIKTDLELQHRRQNDFESDNLFDKNLMYTFRTWVYYKQNKDVVYALSPFAYFSNYKIIQNESDSVSKPSNEYRFCASVELQHELADKFYIIEKGKTVWEGFSQNLTSQIAQKYLGV